MRQLWSAVKTCEDLSHLFTRITRCMNERYVLSVKSEDLSTIFSSSNSLLFTSANIIYGICVFLSFPVVRRFIQGFAGKRWVVAGKKGGKEKDGERRSPAIPFLWRTYLLVSKIIHIFARWQTDEADSSHIAVGFDALFGRVSGDVLEWWPGVPWHNW